jgi:Fe2+ transport system protein FeoA
VEGLIPLSRLDRGQLGVVGHIEGRVDHVHRLEEFGLRRGTRIEMFRPGDPCILRVASNKICLRLNGSFRILVKPAAAP